MRSTHVLASLLALSTVSSAWPWPPSLGDIKTIAQENGLYQKRQDGGGNTGGGNNQGGGGSDNNSSSASSAPASSASASSAHPTDSNPDSSQTSDSASGTNSDSAPTSSGTESDSNANSTTSAASSQYTDSIAPGAQPGGVNMIQPNTQSTPTQYYKVDQTITWIWNYTSLSRPPSAIDIVATVSGGVSSAAPSPFTLATNYSFAPTETFTWDTGKYVNETSALPVGIYTLMVYDAGVSGGVSATPEPGYLAVYNQLRFGMYTGQPSTPLASLFTCATCNSARSSMELHTLWVVVGSAAITVTSFMWFAGGWGVL